MARMGDWRGNKDQEIPLDGIGGVNILVKADVHRSGKLLFPVLPSPCAACANVIGCSQASTSLATPSKTKPRPRASRKWPSALATASTACPTMSSGISIRTRSPVMLNSTLLFSRRKKWGWMEVWRRDMSKNTRSLEGGKP